MRKRYKERETMRFLRRSFKRCYFLSLFIFLALVLKLIFDNYLKHGKPWIARGFVDKLKYSLPATVNLSSSYLKDSGGSHLKDISKKNNSQNQMYHQQFMESISLPSVKNLAPTKMQTFRIDLENFRSGNPTGNSLIDDYGKNNRSDRGEMGKMVILTEEEEKLAKQMMSTYNINTVASDMTPLNRLVPDSRLNNCDQLQYDVDGLPNASVIIPFYDEWPSLLLRTIYSIINRTPRHLLEEIILVDDASTLYELKRPLEIYIERHFPKGLVILIRQQVRSGLINARMSGCKAAKGGVLVILDSHMEVNIDWLQPLLSVIAKERNVVAMASLDYIQSTSMEYRYYHNHLCLYVWNWRLQFYEEVFYTYMFGPDPIKPRAGVTMVGAGYAIDRLYFFELGGYDESMILWGGENLEMSWRVWLCGGRLLHVPCSNIGHVARAQPYSFPKGRQLTEYYNYKRAISVWMGNYSRYVYNIIPEMKTMDVGDITDRLELKSRLGCKDFKWYLDHIWPELTRFDEDFKAWGKIKNHSSGQCLDTNNFLFQYLGGVHMKDCVGALDSQGFTLTNDNVLKSALQCVNSRRPGVNSDLKLDGCLLFAPDKWDYTPDQRLVHTNSQLCLDVKKTTPVLKKCNNLALTQIWTFHPYSL